MMIYSLIILWMDGMWMFKRCFVLDFDAVLDFCCIAEVKVIVENYVRVRVQFLV